MAWEKNSSLIFKKTVSSRRKTCPLRCIKLGNKDYKFQNVISKKKKKATTGSGILCENYFVDLIYIQIFILKNTHTPR